MTSGVCVSAPELLFLHTENKAHLPFLDFVLDLAHNGEIQTVLSQIGSLSTTATQYYTAQIIDAVAYMHNKGVIHRLVQGSHLKPFLHP